MLIFAVGLGANLVVKGVIKHLIEFILGQIGVSIKHLVALDFDDVRFNSSARRVTRKAQHVARRYAKTSPKPA